MGRMPWKIPPRLAANCRRNPERAAWLERLPATLRDLEQRWSLTIGAPFAGDDASWKKSGQTRLNRMDRNSNHGWVAYEAAYPAVAVPDSPF